MVSLFVSLFGFLWRWTFYSFIRSVIFYQWKLRKSIKLRKKCNRDVYIWKYISVCKNILIYYSYYTLISTYRETNIFWQFDRSTILFFDPFSWYKNISFFRRSILPIFDSMRKRKTGMLVKYWRAFLLLKERGKGSMPFKGRNNL